MIRRTVARMSLSGRDFARTLRAPQRTASPQRARSTDAVTTTTLMPALANGAISFSPFPNRPRSRSSRATRGRCRVTALSKAPGACSRSGIVTRRTSYPSTVRASSRDSAKRTWSSTMTILSLLRDVVGAAWAISLTGSRATNVAPEVRESASTRLPPRSDMRRWAMDRPSPWPGESALRTPVLNSRGRTSWATPGPSSVQATSTYPSTVETSSQTVPPPWRRAFSSRMLTTSARSSGSPRARSWLGVQRTSSPRSWWLMTSCSTTSSTSNSRVTAGARELMSRSRRASSASSMFSSRARRCGDSLGAWRITREAVGDAGDGGADLVQQLALLEHVGTDLSQRLLQLLELALVLEDRPAEQGLGHGAEHHRAVEVGEHREGDDRVVCAPRCFPRSGRQ